MKAVGQGRWTRGRSGWAGWPYREQVRRSAEVGHHLALPIPPRLVLAVQRGVNGRHILPSGRRHFAGAHNAAPRACFATRRASEPRTGPCAFGELTRNTLVARAFCGQESALQGLSPRAGFQTLESIPRGAAGELVLRSASQGPRANLENPAEARSGRGTAEASGWQATVNRHLSTSSRAPLDSMYFFISRG